MPLFELLASMLDWATDETNITISMQKMASRICYVEKMENEKTNNSSTQ